MSGWRENVRAGGVVTDPKSVVWGVNGRVRATWRVLLAVPLFWLVAGGFAGTIQAVVGPIPDGGEFGGGLAQSVLHAVLATVALVAWARLLDRRPLSGYGFSATPSWLADLLVGFAAVVAGFGIWFGLGSVLGWTSVSVAASASAGVLLLGLGMGFVALVLHAAVQQLVFFGVVLRAAAEGLHAMGVVAERALAGGLVVGLLSFVLVHDLSAAARALDLAVAGTIFALLYVHTGELALGTGAHLGALYAGNALFVPPSRATGSSVLAVTQSLPGALDALTLGFPKVVVAYLLLIGYLRWRRGGVPVELDTVGSPDQ